MYRPSGTALIATTTHSAANWNKPAPLTSEALRHDQHDDQVHDEQPGHPEGEPVVDRGGDHDATTSGAVAPAESGMPDASGSASSRSGSGPMMRSHQRTYATQSAKKQAMTASTTR